MSTDTTPPPPSKKKRKLKPLTLSPTQQEEVAAWIMSAADSRSLNIINVKNWLAEHPGDYSAKRQLEYDENFVSTCRHLAYLMRRVRPVKE